MGKFSIDTITLSDTLPKVFTGMEGTSKIRASEIWLRRVTFDKGRYYIVEAESGMGKSSLCAYIFGERSDYSGRILFNDRDIRSLTINEWCEVRHRSIAYLPQELRLFPELTALENVMVKNRLTDFKSESEIRAMLSRVELDGQNDRPTGRLSVAQQQRAAIVRALCQPYDFLLIDEPVSHLDARNNRTVADLIVEESGGQGAAVIATSVGNQISLPVDWRFSL